MTKLSDGIMKSVVETTKKLQADGYVLTDDERKTLEDLGINSTAIEEILRRDAELRKPKQEGRDVELLIHIWGYTGTKEQLERTAEEVENNFTLDSLTDFEMSLDPDEYEEVTVEIVK